MKKLWFTNLAIPRLHNPMAYPILNYNVPLLPISGIAHKYGV